MVARVRLVAYCRATGIQKAVKLTDALIAATAIGHGLPVATQDNDHKQMSSAHGGLQVIQTSRPGRPRTSLGWG